MCTRQGGIGPAGLATDDLYVLDLAGAPRWHRVVRSCALRGSGALLLTRFPVGRSFKGPARVLATRTCSPSWDNAFCLYSVAMTDTRQAQP